MKHKAFLAFAMISSLALAQTPPASPAAAKPEPMKEAEKPAQPMAVKQAARKPSPKRLEDARHCLEQPNNTAIIKCAEEYL